MEGNEQRSTLQRLPDQKLRHLAQDLHVLRGEIDQIEHSPMDEKRNNLVGEAKRKLLGLKAAIESALAHASQESERGLLDCYVSLMSEEEKQGIAARVKKSAGLHELSEEREVLDRAEQLLNLVSREVHLPHFERKELVVMELPTLSNFLSELIAVRKELEQMHVSAPDNHEISAKENLIQTALSGLLRKYLRISRIELEAIQKAYRDLQSQPQEEVQAKLEELEKEAQEIVRACPPFSRVS